MKAFVCILATISVACVNGQSASRGYGAPGGGGQAQYGNQGSGSSISTSQSHGGGQGGGDHQGLDWLIESVPGNPGEDYPIYNNEDLGQFAFDCNGQVEGGYYADPNSQCQAFHVCLADGLGGLATQSFLCPNGTIFNQDYFICDWWFNFDCSQATSLYSRNEEVAAERAAASQGGNRGGQGGQGGRGSGNRGSASNNNQVYTSPGGGQGSGSVQPTYNRG